jgi:hypothetical protein
MTLAQYVAARLPQLAAMAVAALLACGGAHAIETTPPQYAESADVMLVLPPALSSPADYHIYVTPLITSEEAVIQALGSPQALRRIRSAGGTAQVGMALRNLYNEEYPEYPEPLATLTASAASAAGVRRSFAAAAGMVRGVLAGWQARAGVPPRGRISARVVAVTGPVEQRGSAKRALAALGLLTAVAAGSVRSALGRCAAARGAAPGYRPGGRARTRIASLATRVRKAALVLRYRRPRRRGSCQVR